MKVAYRFAIINSFNAFTTSIKYYIPHAVYSYIYNTIPDKNITLAH